jgi:serine/threonine-protein kinase
LITTIDEMGGGPWNPDPAKVGLGTSPLLHGDLKAILNKALRPDPRERYSTVERLAADLQDHLEDRPVRARQGGQAYRAAKFLRRHRLGVVNTAIMVLLAIIFTLLLAGQLHETRRSRDQAQGLTDFLVDLFLTAAPDRPAGEEPTVRDLLDAGRDQLRDALKEQEPAARAKLLLRLGEIYTKWGEYEEARSLLEEAIEVLRAARVGPHPDLATALSDLATVDLQTGNLPAAEALYRESLEMRQSLGRDEDLIKPMNNLASILVAQGNLREAVPIYRQTLEIRRARLAASPDDPTAQHNLATSLRSLANALAELADLDAAEPLLRESLALRRRIYGPNSPMVATVEISLGRLEHARGHLPEADQWITRGLNTRVRELGEDHPHTAFARRDQASLRLDQGRSHEARELLRQALETLRQVRPEDDPEIAKAESLLGAALASEGEFEAAAIYLERGLEVLKRRRGLRAPDTLAAQRRRDQFLALKERAALPLGHGEALPQP